MDPRWNHGQHPAKLPDEMEYAAFVRQMSLALPWYEPDNPDLPDVALGGLVSNLAQERAANHERYAVRVLDVLRFIEAAAESKDKRVADLIKVSFIENLHLLGEECRSVVSRLGPRTTKLLAAYENEWGKVCPEAGEVSG